MTDSPDINPAALGKDRVPHANAFLSSWHYGNHASPVLLIASIVIAAAIVIVLLRVVSIPAGMEVVVTPSAASLQRSGEVRALPNEAIQDWARRAVCEFEIYDNATFDDALDRSAEYVHTTYRSKFRADMLERRKQFQAVWLSRYVSPGVPRVEAKGNGRYVVTVPYEQIEYTGRTRKERMAPTATDRVSVFDVVQDLPTDRNSDGLWVVGQTWVSRDDWKAQKNEPLWVEDGRKLPTAKPAKSP